MIKFTKITIKNFMSIGANPQTIDLVNSNLTLILGENLDTSNDSSIGRNGVGKTSVVAALSYGLFGTSLSNITKDNLINNINKKGMFVVVEFEKDGHKFKIERGRKPNFFKFYVDDDLLDNKEADNNEAQGENKDTQVEVEKVLGFSHTLFKNIIALNTKTLPFLNLTAKQQRDFIEELLGILQISQKAEVLKEVIKETKNEIKLEEFRIKTIQDSNESISKSIKDLEIRKINWDNNKETKLKNLEDAINELNNLDVEQEITNHKLLQEYTQKKKNIESNNLQITSWKRSKTNATSRIDSIQEELEVANKQQCPTCNQDVHSKKHKEILNNLQQELEKELKHYEEIESELEKREQKSIEYGTLGEKPVTYYGTIDDAFNHKNSVDIFLNEMENEIKSENPYIDQIDTLKNTSIQEIDFENINTYIKLKDHQEFLLKLLTNKDSFVRKKILDQNLVYLNHRLAHYLNKLGLPHIVNFTNEMTTEIRYMGESLDFDQLSRGESTRVILALCFSFRDIFELITQPINLFFIDEFLDGGGLDSSGCENAYGILKEYSREHGKDVFLISHREDLMTKANNILKVTKENGFTSFQVLTDFI